MSQPAAPPPPFSITARAARRIAEILRTESSPDAHLRVSVAGGGCSGFRYDLAIAERGEPGDIALEQDGARVRVDGMALLYLIGSELDFVEDLNGSYFRVSNPNATASCGCGSSFAV